MGELEERLARYVEDQPAESLPAFDDVLRLARRRRLGARVAGVSAAAVVLLGVVVVVALSLLGSPEQLRLADTDQQPSQGPVPGPCTTLAATVGHAPAPWLAVPPAPLTVSAPPAVWTPEGLMVLGAGQRGSPAAALLDPSTSSWTCLPAPPVEPLEGTAAVWSGRDVLVWNGEPDGAAAWDASTGRWRQLPPVPLPARRGPVAAWTGQRLVVWGGRTGGGARGLGDGAAYDPESDTWVQLPDAPQPLTHADAVWTGEEVIVFGAQLGPNNIAGTDAAAGAAYDPSAGTWRALAPSPLSPQAASAAWVDDRLIAWDNLLEAASYDPASDRWTPIDPLPLGAQECQPASGVVGGKLLAWYCTQAALFDPATGEWEPLPVPDGSGGTIVAQGERAALVGSRGPGAEPGAWLLADGDL